MPDVTPSSEQCASEEDFELQPCETTSEEADENQTQVPEDLCGFFKADGMEIRFDFSKQKVKEEENFDDDDDCEQFFIGKANKVSYYI